jgi:signal peptidase I
MSDTTYDPFNTPPRAPEGFDVPAQPRHEEMMPAADFGAEPVAAMEPIPVMGESVPVPVLAGGMAAPVDPRLAIDRRSVVAGRIADEFVAWLKTLASAAVYATLIVTFGFQVARVEGQSMAPTLADQDRLIVNKAAYKLGDPHVGDIVMLYYPNKPEKSFVKRVIAQEGDQVRIVAGKVYRNEVLMDDSFVPAEYRSHDDWGPEVIPEGYYFVMGDHRNNSSDSRHWGFVPKKYIIGKVQLRWWPVPEARVF